MQRSSRRATTSADYGFLALGKRPVVTRLTQTLMRERNT